MLKAVIFDIDGTLIDSVDLHAQSWLETFERFGVQARFADVRRHIGEGADRLIPAFVPAEMPNGLRKQIEEFRSQLFNREYLCKVKPFPKVKELFAHIKAKRCKLVLASSCSANEIDQYKAIAGIADMTDHDVTADDAGTSKPSPDIFLEALDRLAPINPLRRASSATPSMTARLLAPPASRSSASYAGVLPRRSWTVRERLRFTATLPICSSI